MNNQVQGGTSWEIPCFDQPLLRPATVVVKVDATLGVVLVPPPGAGLVVPPGSIAPLADALKAADGIVRREGSGRRR